MKISISSTREEKIAIGTKFIELLNKNYIEFAGITGSVSYIPNPYDDIDIFIIAKTGMAWKSILDAILKRRIYKLNDICISLVMDADFAFSYFEKLTDKLIIRDALKTIPVYGQTFYHDIILNCPAIASILGVNGSTNNFYRGRKRYATDILAFLLLSPPILAKSIYNNFKGMKVGEGFDIHISFNSFYLDSYKYKILREKFMREEAENGKIFHSDSHI